MKKKILLAATLVVLMVFGFIYMQGNILKADDKDPKNKKDCSTSCTEKTGTSSSMNKSECPSKTGTSSSMTDNKDGYSKYEFVTDKISCDGCKPGMSENLMGIAGVKEVSFDQTNADTKMTNVVVFYSPSDTTPETIAASVKEKGLMGNCADGKKCDGKKSSEKQL